MLVLASLSPRRRELLGLIRSDFAVIEPHADETPPPGLSPEDIVQALALRKAQSLMPSYPDDTLIGADTLVALDGRVLGKPEDDAMAAAMLRSLSGREHAVYTGVALVHNKEQTCFCQKTLVQFRPLTDRDIASYIQTGEPMDKAGSYGIQGKAAAFVSGIVGDYYTVVGLPVCALAQRLTALGV